MKLRLVFCASVLFLFSSINCAHKPENFSSFESKNQREASEYMQSDLISEDLNLPQKDKNRNFLQAILLGSVAQADYWLKHGADINAKSDRGPALLLAADADQGAKMVSLLLTFKPSGEEIEVNARSSEKYDRTTPLMHAAHNYQADIARLLLHYRSASGKKVKINEVDDNGKSALIHACQSGRKETIQLLLEHGANINIATRNNCTPLSMSLEFGGPLKLQIVRLLLTFKAFIENNPENTRRITPININVKAQDGNTALTIAVRYDLEEIINLLLAYRNDNDNVVANITIPNNHRETALSMARNQATSGNFIHRRISRLLQICASNSLPPLPPSPNAELCQEWEKQTLIMQSRLGHISFEKYLMQKDRAKCGDYINQKFVQNVRQKMGSKSRSGNIFSLIQQQKMGKFNPNKWTHPDPRLSFMSSSSSSSSSSSTSSIDNFL